jgi:hypothetical protein
MTDTNGMVDIAQSKLEELVGEDTACVCEAKQTMVREDSPQAHSPSVQYSFIA